MDRRVFARSLLVTPAALAARSRPAAATDTTAPASPGEVPMARANPAHTGEQPGPGPLREPVVLWRFQTNSAIYSSPAVARGKVIFGSDDGFLFAVDAVAGVARWSEDLGSRIRTTPAVSDERIYVANGAFNIRRLESGAHVVKIETALTTSPVPAESPVDGPTIFGAGLRGASGFIDARSPLDGRTRWRHEVVNHLTTAPTVAGDAVYYGTLFGELAALDAATGEERWRFATSGGVFSAPAVAEGLVFANAWAEGASERGAVVPNATGLLYAVDAATGVERWRAQTGSPIESGPAVAGGVVYVGGGSSVFAFEAETGAPVWQFVAGMPVRSSPAVAGGAVYVGGGNGLLYALDTATGERLWSLPLGVDLGAPLDGTPAVVGGVVYVTCGNTLFAVGGR